MHKLQITQIVFTLLSRLIKSMVIEKGADMQEFVFFVIGTFFIGYLTIGVLGLIWGLIVTACVIIKNDYESSNEVE